MRKCAHCTKPLPKGARPDMKFCKTGCRTKSYATRVKAEKTTKPRSTDGPPSQRALLRILLAEVQQERTQAGLPKLGLDPWLCSLARSQAIKQAAEAFQAHHAALEVPLLRHTKVVLRSEFDVKALPATNRVGVGTARLPGGTVLVLWVLGQTTAG